MIQSPALPASAAPPRDLGAKPVIYAGFAPRSPAGTPATRPGRAAATILAAAAPAGTGQAESAPANPSSAESAPADTHQGAGRERFLVLVTDGQVAAEDQILAALAPVTGRMSIFALGIDRAVNAGFLRRPLRYNSAVASTAARPTPLIGGRTHGGPLSRGRAVRARDARGGRRPERVLGGLRQPGRQACGGPARRAGFGLHSGLPPVLQARRLPDRAVRPARRGPQPAARQRPGYRTACQHDPPPGR